MAEPNIRIALCREQDVEALMRFIDAEWQAGHVLSRDEVLLRWQFDQRRLPGRILAGPTVMLAWHHDAIVGMFGLTGCEVTIEGHAASAIWLSHWFASPPYRGYNVAFGMLRAVRELGCDVMATVGANATSTKLLSTQQFEAIPALPRWIGVVNVGETARMLADCNAGLDLETAERWCERYRPAVPNPGSPPSEGALDVIPWRDELATAWDQCWKEHIAGTIVATTRDARFIRWRYLCHPRFRYDVRLARRASDGSVLGLAVFRSEQVRDRRETVMRLVEFLGTPQAQTTLASAVLEAARDLGIAYVDFYCSSASAARGLEALGFKLESFDENQPAFPTRLQPLERGQFSMTALWRLPLTLRGQLDALVRTGRLYVTKSDGDQDRPN